MKYKKKIFQRLSILGWCVSVAFIAIYFFLLVPDSFSGWEDYITYHLFFLLLFFSAERLLLPWITDRLYRGWWVCLYPFVIQFLAVVALVILFSWMVGGIDWKDWQWNISNFWHLLIPLLLPNSLAIVLFVSRQGLQAWAKSENYRLQLLTQELNPHLLNGNLAKLRPLIFFNQKLASRFVKLNNITFHYYLTHRKDLTIPIKEELEQLKIQCDMEEIRRQQSVYLTLDVHPSVLDQRIPTMLLVNLLGNCFDYGIADDSNKPIQITILPLGDMRVCVKIVNHILLSPFKACGGTGTSLTRTADLLHLLDPDSKMHIERDEELFVVIVVYRVSI